MMEETTEQKYNGLPITMGGHKERRKKTRNENIMACPITEGSHN